MVEVRLAGQHGGGRHRAVTVVRANSSPDDRLRFNAPGFYGARFSFMIHLGLPDISNVRSAMALVLPFDRHMAIHVAGRGLVVMDDFIRDIDAPVVIDHMGRPDQQEGPDGPAMTVRRRLFDTGRVWVKLSGGNRLSR